MVGRLDGGQADWRASWMVGWLDVGRLDGGKACRCVGIH